MRKTDASVSENSDLLIVVMDVVHDHVRLTGSSDQFYCCGTFCHSWFTREVTCKPFLDNNLQSSLGLRGCFRGWECGNKDTEVGCESA